MRIGIIGGKGSGKSDLATFLNDETKFIIIDDYVNRLSERTGTAYGVYANHLGNVQVAIERLNEELSVGGDDFITCGTLVDTLVYEALYSIKQGSTPSGRRARITATMEFLGMMMNDTFLYDRLYYLPSEDDQFDFQLKYAFRLYGLKPLEIIENDYTPAIENLKEWEKIVDEIKETHGQGV